jgi:hypothetical protein
MMPRTWTPPRLRRKWVKLVGSDFRRKYPHNEDDTSQQPQRVPVTPTLFEDNSDGSYTQWSFGLFGLVGNKGTLKDGDAVEPLQGCRDFHEALRLERLFDWSLVRQAGMAAVMGGARNPHLVHLAQAARRNFRRRWGCHPI